MTLLKKKEHHVRHSINFFIRYLWSFKTGRTVFSNNWQLCLLSKLPEFLLSEKHQRSDHSQIPSSGERKRGSIHDIRNWLVPKEHDDLLHSVVSLHGPEEAIMEGRHEETLGQVVQMLSHGKDIVALPPSTCVQTSTLHTRAETADGLALWQGDSLRQDAYTTIP